MLLDGGPPFIAARDVLRDENVDLAVGCGLNDLLQRTGNVAVFGPMADKYRCKSHDALSQIFSSPPNTYG